MELFKSKNSFNEKVDSGHNWKTTWPRMIHPNGDLKICSKFTGEQLCRSVISTKLQSKFIEITLWNGCYSLANLAHIFRTHFQKNTSRWLLLFLRLSLGSTHFLYFLFKWRVVNPTCMSYKIYGKWNFCLYLSQNNKKWRGAKT